MPLEYTIRYCAENTYETPVTEAFWQFLVLPEENESQRLKSFEFTNSHDLASYLSVNGFGFKTLKSHPRKPLSNIGFELSCKVFKETLNPFDFIPNNYISDDYIGIKKHCFKVLHEPFLRKTVLTKLPEKYTNLYRFDTRKSVFDNLQALNHWVYIHLYFKPNVTDVNTRLGEIIDKRQGVCQDFTHLFCALARSNGVPARYVSGYLHQGNGYFGDSQMHAWAEAYVPNGGWIGFDPTNDILVAENHIKVAHGKDYDDCAPLKGVVYTSGANETRYTVQVQASQQQ